MSIISFCVGISSQCRSMATKDGLYSPLLGQKPSLPRQEKPSVMGLLFQVTIKKSHCDYYDLHIIHI